MRKAKIFMHHEFAGYLVEADEKEGYRFIYNDNYSGPPVSLTMPVEKKIYEFTSLPPLFDGLLPEGVQLEALLRLKKIDKHDYFSQLVAVGGDLVGAITIEET